MKNANDQSVRAKGLHRLRVLAAVVLLAGGLMQTSAHAQAARPVGANGAAAMPRAASAPPARTGAAAAAAAHGAVPASALAIPAQACQWPLLTALIAAHVQADGRVIDYGPPVQTTSEGQSYGMFFSLVNNDRPLFDRMLAWTQANLAGGDLGKHLPAWRWGQRQDGSYGTLDPNSAADADLWIAYDLAEAGRLWHEPRYTALARGLFATIASREVFDLPGFGPMLAPGPAGFAVAADVWRLNPSYMPLPLLRVAAQHDPDGPWRQIASNTVKLMRSISPHGFSPDWAAYQTGKGFIVDPVKGDIGSYDAIRTYLWAGLTSSADPLAPSLLSALGGMQTAWARTGQVPEKVSTLSGATTGAGPIGFVAALLPYLHAMAAGKGDGAAYNAMRAKVADVAAHPAALGYYNDVLTLFGQGAAEGRFAFDARGGLQPDWSNRCATGMR